MNRAELIKTVNDFLIEEFEIEEDLLTPEATWKDIGIDSLDFVDIVVVVENVFNIKIKGEEMGDVKTLDQFYTFLQNRLN